MKIIIYPHIILRLLLLCLLCLTSCTLSRADEGQHNFMNIGMGGSLPNSTVKCFAEDRSGYLWIGTFDGLVRYDGHSFEEVRPGHVESLLACESGLYIGTTEGLYYMTFSDQLCKPCTWKDQSGIQQTLGSTFITILSVGNKTFALETGGKLWVGNSVDFSHFATSVINECLAICSYDTDKLLILTPQQLMLYDVSKNSITAIGNHSIQWHGGENIYYSTVLDMIIVGQGIGHDTHTFKLLNETIIDNGFDNILPANVKSIINYKNATYIATDGEGVFSFIATPDKKSDCSITNSGHYTPFNGLAGFVIYSLYADSNGNLWMGSHRNGISILSPRLDAFHSYSIASGDLTYNTVTSLYVHQGIIYAGTDGGGLNIVDTNHHTTQSLNASNSFLPANNILGMAWDGQRLWLGIYGHGIYSCDPNLKTFNHIDLSTLGAPQINEVLWKLWYDDRGYIIANGSQTNVLDIRGTLKLSAIKPKENPEDSLLRLASNIPELKDYELLCAYQDIDGTVYYGTTTGIVSVAPSNILQVQRHNDVWLDRLTVLTDSTSYFIGTRHGSEINLSHDQNYFTIHFSVPRISPPDDTHFRFQLEGIDPDWREIVGLREISYAALPPGYYVLHITCNTSDGNWSTNESLLTIHITPPWYATWWAYTAYVLLTLAILWAIIRTYISRRQMRYELLYEKRKHELSKRERLQAEREHEQAKRTQQERIDFLTNITHELRTPMFLITAPLEELLEQKEQVPRTPRSYLKNMLHNAQRITRLIDNVLFAWSPDTSPLQCNWQVANLPALCQQFSGDYQVMCIQKNINFSYVTSHTNLRSLMDVEKLELILSNLVSNAFKYTSNGGSIELRFDSNEKHMFFIVSDTGIGISSNELPHIFDQGYRSSKTSDVKGNGLGLYFVKQLANLLGGDISAESTIGKGSVFTLKLPLRECSENTTVITTPPVEEIDIPDNPTSTYTILVIDDELQTRQLLTRILGREYHVLTAADGEDGLDIARKEMPDLIICDVMMPRMDGFQFVASIKDDKSLQYIPVIMFTARNLDEDQVVAFKHGADAYLTKPVSLELLRTRVRQILHRADSTGQLVKKPSSTLSNQDQQLMLRIKELIEENLLNPQLSVDFLARELGMSASSLYKKVRSMTGHGTVDMIIDTRIYHAVEQMRSGESNITLISDQCGFSDIRSFRAAFKNRMGKSPKQYFQQIHG